MREGRYWCEKAERSRAAAGQLSDNPAAKNLMSEIANSLKVGDRCRAPRASAAIKVTRRRQCWTAFAVEVTAHNADTIRRATSDRSRPAWRAGRARRRQRDAPRAGSTKNDRGKTPATSSCRTAASPRCRASHPRATSRSRCTEQSRRRWRSRRERIGEALRRRNHFRRRLNGADRRGCAAVAILPLPIAAKATS